MKTVIVAALLALMTLMVSAERAEACPCGKCFDRWGSLKCCQCLQKCRTECADETGAQRQDCMHQCRMMKRAR
jgi:hypothetical protein